MRAAATRVATLPPWAARITLTMVIGLLVYGVLLSLRRPDHAPVNPEGVGDAYLYRAIVDRVRAGEGYYSAAGQELRSRGYAVRPFLNWRLPTTARLMARFPSDESAAWLLRGLSFLAILLIALKLYSAASSVRRAIAGVVLFGGAVGITLNEYAIYFHEVWAAVLLTISLAVHHPKHWYGSVVVGTLALFFRELALAYVGGMMIAAWIAGRKSEAASWVVGGTLFLLILTVHAAVVSDLVQGDDLGKSWLALGGWSFVLTTAKWNLFLILSPRWLTAVVVPLALLGAVAWKHQVGLQVSVVLGLYLSAFMVAGNPDNSYWGIMYAPFLSLGVPFCIPALADLWRAANARA